jgi:hypothetical protein
VGAEEVIQQSALSSALTSKDGDEVVVEALAQDMFGIEVRGQVGVVFLVLVNDLDAVLERLQLLVAAVADAGKVAVSRCHDYGGRRRVDWYVRSSVARLVSRSERGHHLLQLP